jgi:hypothetical protein
MVFGMRLMAVVEIVGFLAVAMAIDWAFFAGDRFATVRPHPFWIIVVLVAVQYGSSAGLIAALAASAALLIGNLPPRAFDADVFAYWTEVGLRPALWVGVAQVLGQIRDRQLVERNKLRADLSQTKAQNQLISNSFEELKRAKGALEARIARQFRTVITTYRAAQSIDVTDAEKLESGLDQLISAVLSPRKYSLWSLGPNGFSLDRAVGWDETDTFERTFDLGHPLVRHLLAREPALCAARAADERKMMGAGLLAGALTDIESGEIIGMLKIEDTTFIDFNVYTLENFNVICSWIGAARVRARHWRTMESDRVTGMNAFLMTAEVFERIVALLIHLGERKGFESSELLVRQSEAGSLVQEQQTLFALALGEAARATFRSTDLAFEQETDDAAFAILLPGTPLEHAEGLADKLRTAIAARLPATISIKDVEIVAKRIESARSGTTPAPAVAPRVTNG